MDRDLLLELVPSTVYIERAASGQLLNFDLHLTNRGPDTHRLTSIGVDIFDRKGSLVLRRTVDEHGLRPAIETVPDRLVPAGGSLLVFNPLHTFAPSLAVHRIRCSCVLAGEAGASATVEAEASPVFYGQKTELHLPLTGRVHVAAGHDFLSPHRRIDPSHPLAVQFGLRANSGRYADDLSLVNEAGELFAGDGMRVADWLGFGAAVRAPGSGTVVAAVRDVPDNDFGPDGVEFASMPADAAATIFGNHVVLDHGSGEFSMLAHLQRGSIEVESGDAAEARQPIARLGLSGNTDFVHLHYQLQNGPDARVAEGLPVTFAGVGRLEAGTILES